MAAMQAADAATAATETEAATETAASTEAEAVSMTDANAHDTACEQDAGCCSNDIKIDIDFDVDVGSGSASTGSDDAGTKDSDEATEDGTDEGTGEGAEEGPVVTEDIELSSETEVAGTTWAEYSETATTEGFVDSEEFSALSSYDQAVVTELIAAQEEAGADGEVNGTVTISYTDSSSSEETSVAEEEEEEPATIPVTISMANSTQTVSETSTLTNGEGEKINWTDLREMFTPSEIFSSEIVQGMDAANKAKLVKLYEAHRSQDGFGSDDWSELTERYTVTITTTTRSGPISENSVVNGMTWGEWKASDDFDIDTFAESEGYTGASNPDQKLFDTLIDAQDGDLVIATTESMEIASIESTVEVAEEL